MKNLDVNAYDNSTLDSLLEGFQLIGHDWRYLYVNEAVVKQSKYASKNDLLGFTMMEKYPGIEHTELFIVLRKCMNDRVPERLENEFTFPDQSKGWFELRIEPVPKGIFILSLDITERKKRELEKKEYVAGLEEMLSAASDKIRQPVTNILSASHLLDGSPVAQAQLAEVVAHMKNAAQALDSFTRELAGFLQEAKKNGK